MRISLRMANLAAVVVAMIVGNLPPSYAANCEAALKPAYTCTAAFEGGGSVNYCLALDFAPRSDGEFLLVADQSYYAFCTCKATGNPPNLRFGGARDFFCTEGDT